MPDPLPLNSPVPLDGSHDRAGFDCGVGPLNDYLHKYAPQNQQNLFLLVKDILANLGP